MSDPRVEVHSRTDQTLIDVLEHAYKISYDQQVNAATIGSFELPRDDPKWSAIVPFREIWIYNDLDELVDLFRIAPIQERREDSGTTGLVKLEGYATVLQDDFIYDELIFTNQTVTQILTALLAYQSVARVSLGTVDAALDKLITTRSSNVNVMRACWEVRNVVGGFISVDAVAGNPAQRRLNLRADPGQDIGQRVYKGFNLRNLTKSTESQSVLTKLWPLGRGEGRSQQRPSTDKLLAQPATFTFVGAAARSTLAITGTYSRYKGWTVAGAALPDGTDAKDTRSRPLRVYRNGVDDTANWQQGPDERILQSTVNGYNPAAATPWTLDYVHADYLIADDTVAAYGTLGGSYVDKNYENSPALISAARGYLDGTKQPRISHEIRVHDLARIYTSEPFERLHLFDKINVWDDSLGVTTKDRVVAVKYGDLQDPTTFEISVTNIALAELSSRAANLSDRIRKYEGQPDGATTLYGPDSFEDNLDPTHPYTRNIEIPTEAISILALKLRMRAKPYRYYVASAASQAGGSSTTSSGGGSSTTTSNAPVLTTSTDGSHMHGQSTGTSLTAHSPSVSVASVTPTSGAQNQLHQHTVSSASHDHTNAANTPYTVGLAGGTSTESANHDHYVTHAHGATVSVTDHGIHYHTGAQSDGTHLHNVPAHSHTVDMSLHTHTVTIASHTHPITVSPGINETTTPAAMTVAVDGNAIPGTATSLDDFDLTPYLTRNADGTIVRGLHQVTFTPDTNGRVQATISGMLFLQSRGKVVG